MFASWAWGTYIFFAVFLFGGFVSLLQSWGYPVNQTDPIPRRSVTTDVPYSRLYSSGSCCVCPRRRMQRSRTWIACSRATLAQRMPPCWCRRRGMWVCWTSSAVVHRWHPERTRKRFRGGVHPRRASQGTFCHQIAGGCQDSLRQTDHYLIGLTLDILAASPLGLPRL